MSDAKLQEAETKIANQRKEIAQLRKTLAVMDGVERREASSPTAGSEALRQAGFFRVPRWYFTQDQLDVIERMAFGNKEEVYRIKREAHGE